MDLCKIISSYTFQSIDVGKCSDWFINVDTTLYSGMNFNGSSYIFLILLNFFPQNFVNDCYTDVRVECCSVVLFPVMFLYGLLQSKKNGLLTHLASSNGLRFRLLSCVLENFMLNCYYFLHKVFGRFSPFQLLLWALGLVCQGPKESYAGDFMQVG